MHVKKLNNKLLIIVFCQIGYIYYCKVIRDIGLQYHQENHSEKYAYKPKPVITL